MYRAMSVDELDGQISVVLKGLIKVGVENVESKIDIPNYVSFYNSIDRDIKNDDYFMQALFDDPNKVYDLSGLSIIEDSDPYEYVLKGITFNDFIEKFNKTSVTKLQIKKKGDDYMLGYVFNNNVLKLLSSNLNIVELYISGTDIDGDGIVQLAEANVVQKLNVSNTLIMEKSFKALANNTSIHELNLSNCMYLRTPTPTLVEGDFDVNNFSTNTTITKLVLHDNYLKNVSKLLTNQHIINLDLSYNKIDDDIVDSFPDNITMKINLTDNPITIKGVTKLKAKGYTDLIVEPEKIPQAN